MLKFEPGTKFEKIYKGTKYVVKATKDGYSYNGEIYNSLGAVVKKITKGKAVSASLFFGLDSTPRKKNASVDDILEDDNNTNAAAIDPAISNLINGLQAYIQQEVKREVKELFRKSL